MSQHSQRQLGFTAVELLVTLFVAAAFIIAGYQLFNVVIRDGGDTRAKAAAANAAYAYLRQYSDSATNPCSSLSPLTNEPATVDGLTDVTVTVVIQCAQADAPTLSKVDVTLAYNKDTPKKTLTYSTYVDKSTGASTNTDVTDGLIAWWKFNGTTNSSVGAANGTIVGSVNPITGQNGSANSAYNFGSSCCNYIHASNFVPLPVTATFSAWVYPTAYPSERAALFVSTPTGSSGFFFSLNSDGSVQTYRYGASSPGYHSSGASTVPLNQWTFVTAVWDTTQVKLYTNGSLKATITSVAVPHTGYGVDIGTQSASLSRQYTGRMDDMRIYNRALSGSEVSQLYAGGAK